MPCRGLLVSKMYDTAKAVVNNLLWLVDVYGHVLNGARVYYSNRRFVVPEIELWLISDPLCFIFVSVLK